MTLVGVAAIFIAPATVQAQAVQGDLQVSKTVAAGHDAGAGCPGEEILLAAFGAAVTYCFEVTNTGDTTLAPVTLTDEALNIDESDMSVLGAGGASDPLASVAPGESVTLYYESEVTGSLLNIVSAAGTPVDDAGDVLAGADIVSTEDGAVVAMTSLSLSKTVYNGHDAGAACPGRDLITSQTGDDVTYCFEISNAGATTLAPVTLVDPDLDVTDEDMVVLSGDLSSMASGETAVLYYESSVDGDLTNTATASGVAVDQAGDPLAPGADPVTAVDQARVEEADAAITLEKTVYRGHDNGAACPGVEKVRALHDGEVTYCFEITNEGETTLAPVTLADPDIGLTDADMTLLSGDLSLMAPDDTAVLYVESTVDGDLTNTATAAGVPVDEGGNPLVDVDAATDADTAEVEEVDAELSLLTEVFDPYTDTFRDADDDESSPGANDATPATLAVGDTAIFRFSVLNGSDTDFTDVVVDAPLCDESPVLVEGDGAEPGILEPEEEWLYNCQTRSITKGFTMEATVDATVDLDSTASDDPPVGVGKAESARVQVAAVAIEASVLDPSSGEFADTAVLSRGADALFRVLVENVGDAPLADLAVADPEAPDCVREFEGVLAPGDAYAAYECTVQDIGGGFVNTAGVVGVPVDDSAERVADDVTAEASAIVTSEAAATTELAIDKSLLGANAIDRTAAWEIVVTNVGAVEATEPTVVIDELPLGLEYVGATGEGWQCDLEASFVRCANDTDIAPGGSARLILDTAVAASGEVTVVNVARIDGGDGGSAAATLDMATMDGHDSIGPGPTSTSVDSGSLPRTGVSVEGWVALGTLLVIVGAVAVGLARRQEAR